MIKQYVCEICNSRYNTEEEAVKCESNPRFDATAYPAGLMFARFNKKREFSSICAIPETPKPRPNYVHVGYTGYWICYKGEGFTRKNPHDIDAESVVLGGGDYLYSDCDSLKTWKDKSYIPKEYVGNEEFNCMVNFLRDKTRFKEGNAVVPCYYDEDGNLITVE